MLPVGKSFRAGAYFTKETVNSEMDESFSHTGIGLTWLGSIPADIEQGEFGIQMGGYFGYGLLSHEILDSQSGMEMGILLGPVMRVTEHFEVAAHMASWSGYFSGRCSGRGVDPYAAVPDSGIFTLLGLTGSNHFAGNKE